MMVEPFELIANYVRHADAHIRRNVAVAIGTLPTPEAVAALLDMASNDPDPEVRETAESQLASVGPAHASLVRAELARRVHVEDPAKRNVANALAGRLYLRGFDLRAPEDRLLPRLRALKSGGSYVRTLWRLAKDLAQRFRQAGVSRRFSFRTLWAGFLGAVVPCVLLCVYLQVSLPAAPSGDVYNQIALITTFIAIGLTLRIGRRDAPLILQWDEPAAIARDIVETTVWATALVAPFTFLMMIGFNVKQSTVVKTSLIAAAVVSVALAAVHLGNAAFAHQSRAGMYARFQRYFVACSSGLAVLTLALFIGRQFELNENLARVPEAIWLFGIPACGALALILARQDTASVGVSVANPRRRQTRRVASIALALPAVLALLFGCWKAVGAYLDARRTNAPLSSINWDTVSGTSKNLTLPWQAPQTRYQLRLPFPQVVHIDPRSNVEEELLDVALLASPIDRANPNTDSCDRSDNRLSYVMADRYAGTERLLPAGCYEIRVSSRRIFTPRRLWQVLTARTRVGRAAMNTTQTVPVILNADGAIASNGQPVSPTTHAAWVVRPDDPPQVIRLAERRGLSIQTGRPPELLWSDKRDVEVTVTQPPSTDPVLNELDLKPGDYSIAVKSLSGGSVSAYLALVPPRPRQVWLVTRAPSDFQFRVESYSIVLAELRRGPRQGSSPGDDQALSLEMERLDRRELGNTRGPGTIRTELAPGEYRLLVRSPAPDVSLRVPWTLRLEIVPH